MHEVLVNRLGGLSLPKKSVARLTDRPDMTLDVYRGRKTTRQQQQNSAAATALYKPNDVSKCSIKGYRNMSEKYNLNTKLLLKCFNFVTLTLGQQQQHPDDVK